MPGQLFAELFYLFVLKNDHAPYACLEERPSGTSDVWMNVEANLGATERALFAAFYGGEHNWDNAGWREMAAFSSCVLHPLEWAGLLVQTCKERLTACASRIQDAALAQLPETRHRLHVAASFCSVDVMTRSAQTGHSSSVLNAAVQPVRPDSRCNCEVSYIWTTQEVPRLVRSQSRPVLRQVHPCPF